MGFCLEAPNTHKQIRQEIIENHKLDAVISMPSGVFKPYAGVSTAVLYFTKTGTGGTDQVWFYDMQADGYSLDDKRNVTKENDIPDLLQRWKNQKMNLAENAPKKVSWFLWMKSRKMIGTCPSTAIKRLFMKKLSMLLLQKS